MEFYSLFAALFSLRPLRDAFISRRSDGDGDTDSDTANRMEKSLYGAFFILTPKRG
jgi:hypothetical protein